jgi:hypothetical protein
MNVEIGAEAAQFPEKEYINEIAVAVQRAAVTSRRTTDLATHLPYAKNDKSKMVLFVMKETHPFFGTNIIH